MSVKATRPLFLVTDGRAALDQARTRAVVLEALDGAGERIRGIVLREQVEPTPLTKSHLEDLFRFLQPYCAKHGVALLVHRELELAVELNADGLHLQKDVSLITRAREMLGPTSLIGYSAHSEREIREAISAGADYCFFSPVFKPNSKVDQRKSIGLEYLREVCKSALGDIIALGGITAENAGHCREAGASGFAVVGAVFGSATPGRSAQELAEAWEASAR